MRLYPSSRDASAKTPYENSSATYNTYVAILRRTCPENAQNTGRMSISPMVTACLPCSTSTSSAWTCFGKTRGRYGALDSDTGSAKQGRTLKRGRGERKTKSIVSAETTLIHRCPYTSTETRRNQQTDKQTSRQPNQETNDQTVTGYAQNERPEGATAGWDLPIP